MAGVFFSLASANTNEAFQKIQAEAMPKLAALQDDVALDPRVFARVKAVWAEREMLKLDQEQRKLLEETYKGFVRGGANLSGEQQKRFREINQELSSLSTHFADNLLAETNAYKLVVEKPEDLAGLSPQTVAAAAETAKRAGLEGKWVFTLQPSSMRPFVAYADNRELRRQIWTAYKTRADHGNEHDNNRIAARIATLRAERAKLLGYTTFADFQIAEYMAKTPANVYSLMSKLWAPAVVKADEDARVFQAMLNEKHPGVQIEPYDWGYYAEKVKKARYEFDEEALRPYFPLDRVREGAFTVATRLYGLTFTERPDLPRYHPDVRTYEVKEADGTHVGVLVLDYFPRAGKRGGAWSGSLRDVRVRDGKDIRPIVTNVASFTPPTGDTPALLSRGEVETLFHEFGHALHGLLTRVHYSSLGNVPWDFVELPSQIMEHWVLEPEVLRLYARHYKTGEVLPDEVITRIRKAEYVQPGVRHAGDGLHGAARPRLAHPDRSQGDRRQGVREGVVRAHGAAPLRHLVAPHAGLRPHLQRRLCGRLLLVPVVRGAGQRRLRGVQGEGDLRPGHRRLVPEEHPRACRHRRRGRGVPPLPWERPLGGADPAQAGSAARAAGGPGVAGAVAVLVDCCSA